MSTNLVGATFGKLEVISKHSVANKKVRWNVKCLTCSTEYDLATDTLKKNANGCQTCSRSNSPKGIDSIYWKGGRYISSVFLSNVKRSAKKRGIEVTIDIADLDAVWEMQAGKCKYTGRQLTLSGDDCTASLDRIDSNLGYIPFNIQFLHKDVNIAKWAMKEEVFFEMIKEIYDHRIRKDD